MLTTPLTKVVSHGYDYILTNVIGLLNGVFLHVEENKEVPALLFPCLLSFLFLNFFNHVTPCKSCCLKLAITQCYLCHCNDVTRSRTRQ